MVTKFLCGVVLASTLALLFAVRLEQAQRRYRRGMDERHAERERIARDVHDTLLQGAQALLFRLQIWEEDPDIPAPLRIAGLMAFVVSPAARWMTGAVLRVDGGEVKSVQS